MKENSSSSTRAHDGSNGNWGTVTWIGKVSGVCWIVRVKIRTIVVARIEIERSPPITILDATLVEKQLR